MKSISAARYVLTTVAATGLVLVGVTPTRAQIPAKWNTFSAEVTLNRYEIGADGKPAGFKAPVVTYRFERIAAPSGWRTVFSLIAAERQKVQPLKGREREVDSLSVVRLEDDGDGTPIRVTTRDGRRPVSRLPVSVVKDGLDTVLSLNPESSCFTVHDAENETGAVGRGSRLGRFDCRQPGEERRAPLSLAQSLWRLHGQTSGVRSIRVGSRTTPDRGAHGSANVRRRCGEHIPRRCRTGPNDAHLHASTRRCPRPQGDSFGTPRQRREARGDGG